jgi:hypothetical protein
MHGSKSTHEGQTKKRLIGAKIMEVGEKKTKWPLSKTLRKDLKSHLNVP